jgi:hypothetical protein
MNLNRPHIIARKSILPAFKFRRIFSFLLCVGLAAVCGLFGKDIVSGFAPDIASYAPLLAIVFGVLALIPLTSFIVHVILLRSVYVEFYDSFVIKKRGVFNKTEEKCMFPKVLSCNVYRSFWGRVFNYGNIQVDVIGKWDIDLTNIKRPLFVRKYLENHFISAKEIRAMRQTVVTQ